MIVHDVEQGSDEWHQIRLARPTASNFAKLLTKPQKKADREAGMMSQTAKSYLAECFAEWAIGEPVDGASSPWMERGQRQEAEALDHYRAFLAPGGAEVKRVGFVTLGADLLAPGCSPDALVGGDGGVEIKIFGAKKHPLCMFEPERFLKEYYAQVQGGLWITGRAWWHLVAYNPEMQPVVHRVEPDETFILNLEAKVAEFTAMLEERLAEFGYRPLSVSKASGGPESLPSQDKLTGVDSTSPAASEAKLAT